jgi:hypothetical protein
MWCGFTLVHVRTHTWCHDCLHKASREDVQGESRVSTCVHLVNARRRSCQVFSSSARACISSTHAQDISTQIHHALQFSEHLYHISFSFSLDPSLARCHALSRSLVLLLSLPPASWLSGSRSQHTHALEAHTCTHWKHTHARIRSIAHARIRSIAR